MASTQSSQADPIVDASSGAATPAVGRGRGILAPELGSWIPVALYAAFFALTLLQILIFNDGQLVYALDDSYIGYALAEEIARGNYGINPGEASSPASTALWPFLIAPLLALPGGLWLPLLINFAALALAVHVVYVTLFRSMRDAGMDERTVRALATFGGVASLVLLNLMLVTFSGMEHGLQVLLAVLVAAGLIELAASPERGPGRLLAASLVVGPLIRFEALALTVPALAVIWAYGHRRRAVLLAVATVAPIALFVAFLTGLGVGPLPSSIMSRTSHVWEAEAGTGAFVNLRANLSTREGLLMALLVLPFLGMPFDRSRLTAERWLAAWLVVAVALHFQFGMFGYWGRYETYAWAFVLVTIPFLARRGLARWVAGVGTVPALAVGACIVTLLSWAYMRNSLQTPLASNDIYIEHMQMHRIASEVIEGPVAVNDVGYVSFQNDNYVLDLWGLTSHDVRRLRESAGNDVRWLDPLVREHGVDFVMLYPQWFPRIPSSWTPIGEIRIERFKAFLQYRTVSLVATRPEAIPRLREALLRFAPEMPMGSRLDVYDAPETDPEG